LPPRGQPQCFVSVGLRRARPPTGGSTPISSGKLETKAARGSGSSGRRHRVCDPSLEGGHCLGFGCHRGMGHTFLPRWGACRSPDFPFWEVAATQTSALFWGDSRSPQPWGGAAPVGCKVCPSGLYEPRNEPRHWAAYPGSWHTECHSHPGRIPPSYWLAFRSTHKLAKAIAKASYDDPAGQISRYFIPGVITES
jgi:hypothetical protein